MALVIWMSTILNAHLHDLHNGDQVGQCDVISRNEGLVLDELILQECQGGVQVLQGCVQLVLRHICAQNLGNQKLQHKHKDLNL